MNKITNIIIHPAFLALVISLLIIWITPPFFSKYQIELKTQTSFNSDLPQRQYFHDFDHDGESEVISKGMNTFAKVPYIAFFNDENSMDEEWNCPGEWVKNSPVIFGDYDHNGNDEVYGFTYLNDSIFLNGVEPYGNWNFEIKKKYICKVEKYNGNHAWTIHPGKVKDLDGDGYGEVAFAINSGYALQPRGVFAYDILNDTIYRSPYMGAAISEITFDDIDQDNLDEILACTSSSSNFNELSVPYSDTCDWVLVFDNDLDFYFEPIALYGKYGGAKNYTLYQNGEPYIFSHHANFTAYGKVNKLRLFDLNGNLIDQSEPDQYFGTAPFKIIDKNEPAKLFYFYNDHIYRLDKNLKVQIVKKLTYKVKSYPWIIDLNNDSISEFIFSTNDASGMVIYRNDFSNPVIIDQPPYAFQTVSVKHSKNNPAQICINAERSYSIYEYKENPYYYFKYPFYLLLYLLLFGFFHILFLFQNQRIKKIYETERRLNELQMLTIRNQMNPHFTFNAINSISSVIYKEDKKTAYNFFTKFSDLIRFTLKNAEKISVPLSEEIEFVKNYLDLEKFRFKEKFDFTIAVDKNIDKEIQVPRMMIQTFAENAVKHGLSHLEKAGLLKINISQQDHKLNLVIEDNGIGREAAGKLDIHGTGKGMKIIEQIFDLYHKLKGKKISHSIIDLKDDNSQPTGTRIIVELEI